MRLGWVSQTLLLRVLIAAVVVQQRMVIILENNKQIQRCPRVKWIRLCGSQPCTLSYLGKGQNNLHLCSQQQAIYVRREEFPLVTRMNREHSRSGSRKCTEEMKSQCLREVKNIASPKEHWPRSRADCEIILLLGKHIAALLVRCHNSIRKPSWKCCMGP